jgi:hypothetical protein
VVVEAQVRDYGFSPTQEDEIWRRWREGQSFSLMGRALGAPMHHVRRFLYQSGGVRQAPQQRSKRHLTGSEREEISRGIAAGESARRLAQRPALRGSDPWTTQMTCLDHPAQYLTNLQVRLRAGSGTHTPCPPLGHPYRFTVATKQTDQPRAAHRSLITTTAPVQRRPRRTGSRMGVVGRMRIPVVFRMSSNGMQGVWHDGPDFTDKGEM